MSKELKALTSIPSDAIMEMDQQDTSPTRCYIQVYEKKPERNKMYFEEALAQGSSHRSDSQQKEAMGQTIFGKAKEFGADEKLLSKKLDCLESLLHNYAGINGMKDDFASMMYSSGNKFNMTNTRIKVGVADIVKKNDIKQPEKIDEELQSQL